MHAQEFDSQVCQEAQIFNDHLRLELQLLGARWQALTDEALKAGVPNHLVLASLHYAISSVREMLDVCKEMDAQ